ncbi:hypothetical protein GUJ93_ZPchr0013g34775 [Zizania palustris]|uniref:Uncharacterized protein n=1 Tax=Zizania palustris TaxID=103762 RepID=A0A8J5X077_ZIZPA|nr:hypothetical protein GUJ93_ZPchr0013g34775 [Zizania palustris]
MATKQSLLALLAIAASVVLIPSASVMTNIEYCNRGKNYPVKVSGMEIMLDSVARGEPATFKISASTVVYFVLK